MRTSSATSGSATDRLHALIITIKGLRDAEDAAYRFPGLQRGLESVAARVAAVRRQDGQVAGLEAAADWLRSAIEQSPALAEPGSAGLKEELLILARRLRA